MWFICPIYVFLSLFKRIYTTSNQLLTQLRPFSTTLLQQIDKTEPLGEGMVQMMLNLSAKTSTTSLFQIIDIPLMEKLVSFLEGEANFDFIQCSTESQIQLSFMNIQITTDKFHEINHTSCASSFKSSEYTCLRGLCADQQNNEKNFKFKHLYEHNTISQIKLISFYF